MYHKGRSHVSNKDPECCSQDLMQPIFFFKDFANSQCQILEGVGFLIIFFRSRISPKALESSLVSLQSDSLNNNLALREKGAPPKMPVAPAHFGPPVSWGKFPGLGRAGQSLAGLRAASSEDQQCHLVGEFSKHPTSG